MPRGNHRGGIYPVTGALWGLQGTYRKRGLYHGDRTAIHTPRWGYRYQTENPSPFPDGSAKITEKDASKAWMSFGSSRHKQMYALNENKYFLPAIKCTDVSTRNYLYECLDPSTPYGGRSGIGLCGTTSDSVSTASHHLLFPAGIVRAARMAEEEKDNKHNIRLSIPKTASQSYRMPKLWQLVCESDIWRSQSRRTSRSRVGSDESGVLGNMRWNEGSSKTFPYVDDSASLLRELSLMEILYQRSNHRIKCRRHPTWIHNAYRKLHVKKPYKFRQRQAALETLREHERKLLGIDN